MTEYPKLKQNQQAIVYLEKLRHNAETDNYTTTADYLPAGKHLSCADNKHGKDDRHQRI